MVGDMLGTPTPPQIRTGYAHAHTRPLYAPPRGGGGHTVDQAAQGKRHGRQGAGVQEGESKANPPLRSLPATA